MTDTKTPPRLRPLTRTEQAAVDLLDQGTDIAVVCDQTGLSRPQVAAAADLRDARAQALSSAAAEVANDSTLPKTVQRTLLLSPVRDEPPAQGGQAARAAEKAEPVRWGVVDELLEWGRTHQNEETRNIVDSVVAGLGRLRDARARWIEMQRLLGQEKQLAGELDAVRQQIRQLHGGLLPADLDRETRHRIREWGRRNGFSVGAGGTIRAEVLEAFWRAHTPAA